MLHAAAFGLSLYHEDLPSHSAIKVDRKDLILPILSSLPLCLACNWAPLAPHCCISHVIKTHLAPCPTMDSPVSDIPTQFGFDTLSPPTYPHPHWTVA